MHWIGVLLFVLLAAARAQDFEETTVIPVTDSAATEAVEETSTTVVEESRTQLNQQLRSALLKALTDLENEGSSEASDENDDGRDITKARASAVTIFSDESDNRAQLPPSDKQAQKQDFPISTQFEEEDPSKQKASSVIFQQSQAVQAHSITSLEQNPLDPVQDVEHIITSASNSFITKDSKGPSFQSEEKGIQSTAKVAAFANVNTISTNESKKPFQSTIVEKFSIGKTVDEPNFVKSSEKSSGKSNVAYVKAAEDSDSKRNDVKETVTEVPAEVSTEENEAKVEQVQFFSAPLVAAFTVHQDEQGQPKKVEPIYKKVTNVAPIRGEALVASQSQPIQQNVLQSSSFHTLDLEQKQQILERELEKLRFQQQNLLARSNFGVSNQNGFKQAINQNFNQFDPVFSEPDRSVVTKLATIDPSTLLSQSPSPLLNKFMPSEAILPVTTNNLGQKSQLNIQTTKSGGDVSLTPSISFDPLVEAGKLPENAQILPTKPPRGFHSFVQLARPQNQLNLITQPNFNQIQPSLTPIQSTINQIQPSVLQNLNKFQTNQFSAATRFLKQDQGIKNIGSSKSTFSIVPAQQPFAPKHELSYFPDNKNFLRQSVNNQIINRFFRSDNNNFNQNPSQNFAQTNQNRFFRSNLESGAQAIDIQPSIQPFSSQGNRFFRSNQENTVNALQNTRLLRSNLENNVRNGGFQGSVLQKYKYSNSFGFPTIPLHRK